MMNPDFGAEMGIGEQILLLLEHGVDPSGDRRSLNKVAENIGISYQALVNLIQGKAANPRLKTLLALCQYYGISLDYFVCGTRDSCQQYLKAYRLRTASPLIAEIERTASQLSSKGQHNVLTMMAWMESAKAANSS